MEEPDFALDTALTDGTVLIRMRGELDLATVGQLRDEIERTFTAPRQRLVLDCRELTFMDSTGVTLMLSLHRAAGRDGLHFMVAPGDGAARALLQLTGLVEHLTLVDDPSIGWLSARHADGTGRD